MVAQRRRGRFDPLVVTVAGGLSVAFVLAGGLFVEETAAGGQAAWRFISTWFDWVYVLATVAFVIFALWLAFSRFGAVKLGAEDDEPEFSTLSWIAMMFAIGMGIGLIFYGAAEPVMLMRDPPPGMTAGGRDAARAGMEYSLFHWCLHPWAFFGVAGLALGYVTHRKGRRTLISSNYEPLLGGRFAPDRIPARSINIVVIVATLFGNAVTLGLGTLQISSGLSYLTDFNAGLGLQAAVIAVLTVVFVLSAISGVARGIQWLANTNVLLALGLLGFLLVLGPVEFILDLFAESLGGYLNNFLSMSFQTGAFGGDQWMSTWTIFLWAWGISWAPYVGTFLARISRGRTIREYVIGVLVVPSLVTAVWFAVLGGTALDLQLSGERDIAGAAGASPEVALFETLQAFPAWQIMTGIVIVLAAVFFVAGADAGAIVLGTFSSWGSLRPARWLVSAWGVMIGAVAVILLLVGGLDALQWAAIVAASPFVVILIGMCIGLYRDLAADPQVRGEPLRIERGVERPRRLRIRAE
jgi:choline/carnitine/betaine transport